MGNKLIENKKDKILVGILAGLGAVLITLTVIFFIQRAENKRFISEITNEKENLQTELQQLSVDYANLETNNDTLKVKLENEQEKITQLIEKMRVFRNNSYAEIARYKKEVGTLKNILRSYVVQIDSLNRINEALVAENRQVKKQMSWAKERAQNLEKEKAKMQQTLSKAAALEARDFKIYPVNRKDREVRKYRKAEKLKADFVLRKNITAERGTRTLYLRVETPDKSIIANPDQDTFKYENSKLIYTAKRSVEYEGEELEVSIYWNNDGSLGRGKYTAYLFSEKHLIGTASFQLK